MLMPLFVRSGSSGGSTPTWVRPSDWPAMPTSAAQEVDILAAVWNNGSNYCALSVTVSSGTFTVNWGDGTAAQTYTSGSTASYQYSYSASGLGSLTSEGYKTAVIKITPTTGGATITALDTGKRNSLLSGSASNPWLDMQINASSLISVSISGSATNSEYLQRCNIVAIGAVTSLQNCFYGCSALQSFTFPSGSLTAVTNLQSCFTSCYALQSVTFPSGSLTAVTNISYCFQNCYALQSVTFPAIPAAANVTFSNGSASIGWAANNLYAGQAIRFATTGALPTNFTAGTIYYVSATGLGANNFQVSATNGGGVITAGSAGSGTQSATILPLAAITNAGTAFSSCGSLADIENCAIPVTFSVASCNLSAANLNVIYTSLPTVSGQTISRTGNIGSGSDTTSIATAKGWTVA